MSIRAMAWVLDLIPRHLSPTVRHVALVLADHVNDSTDEAWPSISRIAERTGHHPRTVQRALRELELAGVIDVLPNAADHHAIHPHRRPNRYLWKGNPLTVETRPDGTTHRHRPPGTAPPHPPAQ